MALRAEHPSKAFSHDLRSVRSDIVNAIDQYAPMHPDTNHLNRNVLSNPHSEQTCNVVSCSRKRNSTVMNQNLIQQQPARLSESASLTSTSGRPTMMPITLPSPVPPLAQVLYAHLYQQNVETDAIIRRHNERLRSGLEESRKRQCRAVMSTLLESEVMKRLREKETELELANRRNAELEESIRRLSTENQVWFDLARSNEAIASGLMASLEQLQYSSVNAAVKTVDAGDNDDKEGYGDSEAAAAGDVGSCCFEGDAAAADADCGSRVCRACCEREVSVLLLPCKHLCLCKECGSDVEACPVCLVTKNASLQVFMSTS